ncbi:MAG: M20 family metallopeptidase [Lysobacterales bacterium]
MSFDAAGAQSLVDQVWDDDIVPQLTEYIKIPNKSPHFDSQWAEHGYMEDAVSLISRWCDGQGIAGQTLEVVRLDGRTPVIFMEIPGTEADQSDSDDCVLLYGHLDKQPEMEGWSEGLGPWTPVYRDGKLFGRGGADDGYAAFASLTAIRAVQEQRLPHARCVVLIEACEESGSYDLPFYIDHLQDRIGTPSLVVCLDSGAGNYDQLWVTTSLRGLASGTLTVDILTEGVHSGYASGIVPSSFRIARELVNRIDDPCTGHVNDAVFQCEIPSQRRQQLSEVAALLGDEVHSVFPFVEGANAMGDGPLDRLLNRNWRAALSVVGSGGLPAIEDAGNVLRPGTSLKLSLRLPPLVNGDMATEHLKALLESNPPANAQISFVADQSATGWNAPTVAPWLEQALASASLNSYGAKAMYMGEGGTIPFMAMLGQSFPKAQFMIVGVLGPQSNAHGPNEFIHVPYAKRLTTCVASVLVDHWKRHGQAAKAA